MRIIVTGLKGQVAAALAARAGGAADIVLLGRPQLDLADGASVRAAFEDVSCDAIINAAAYTAVDRAETDEAAAFAVNADGAGFVAEAAARKNVPLLQVSTDYVFDGSLERPYREEDATGPTGVYGRSKLLGERKAAAAHENCAIFRTAWVYSPFGANFVRTMLRLGETRDEIGVVADQLGNPTSALDIADALLIATRRMIAAPGPETRGVFHMTGAGDAAWADFAEAIFDEAARRGGRRPAVKRIATQDYPTPARRPKNSRLDNRKFQKTFNHALPEWRVSLKISLDRLLQSPST